MRETSGAPGREWLMALKKIYAQLNCTDSTISAVWYEKLFGRQPGACPMKGFVEWHHGDAAGLQLFENDGDAGHRTLTLTVERLRDEQTPLTEAGLSPSEVGLATSTSLVRLRDPDGNLIVLAQPGPT